MFAEGEGWARARGWERWVMARGLEATGWKTVMDIGPKPIENITEHV